MYKRIDDAYVRGCMKEFICDTDADLENLPDSCVGSTAVSIESGKVMVVNTEGKWVEFGVPAVSESIIGTWVFNDELNFDELTVDKEYMMNGNYTDDNGNLSSFSGFKYYERANGIYAFGFGNPSIPNNYDPKYLTDTQWGQPKGWAMEYYKTITILEEPTDLEFITWLKANATKQGA